MLESCHSLKNRMPYNLSDTAKSLKTPANKGLLKKTYRYLLLSCRLTAALEKKNKIHSHRLKLQSIPLKSFNMISLYFSIWYQVARLDFTKNWIITVHSTPGHEHPQTMIKVHSNSELRHLQVLLKGQRRLRLGLVAHVSEQDIRKHPAKIKYHFGSRRRNVTTTSWFF